ncbi:MAG TPA: flagellar basal body rod protein FlgB [Xanthobacteraceae bacterium]|nr:flagellar basal body rod protein FlgB [Xanthobacteraceae bacterium]
MAISELPILAMLRSRMLWGQERQRLLAENVANADTPGFRPRDLAPLDVNRAMAAPVPLALARTNPGHLAGGASGVFRTESDTAYEIRPAGNGVSLEDEMLKVAANQMDYQAAASLYARSLALFKTALGKR